MNRTHARALALVNWKGVFYQRYALDRHVTALEGVNGAGKTTVMIAAYIVLMPDMTRLSFANVGETGATGGDKGIWGRLGESGRPSYAVMDFATPTGQRLIAGVHLERKGEPSVEPTPFIITGLADDVRLQDILLLPQGRSEVVPELNELRENVARCGGRLQNMRTARDYFATLFDHGVNALRLSSDEERGKFNELLRTSMMGGISRKLTSELRMFLLKAETGMADTLNRMKSNFDECRRTRHEVSDAQGLEQTLGGIFEAGQGMYVAAYQAARAHAAESRLRVEAAETEQHQAAQQYAAAKAQGDEICAALQHQGQRLAEVDTAGAAAEQLAQQLALALDAARDLAQRRQQLSQRQDDEQQVRAQRDSRAAVQAQRNATLKRRQADANEASLGLANLQQGLDQLHHHAAAYRQLTQQYAQAQRELGVRDLPVDTLPERLQACRDELIQVDRTRGQLKTRRADAEQGAQTHATVLTALCTLVGADVAAEDADTVARQYLARHRELTLLARREHELAREAADAADLATRQAAAHAQAHALGLRLDGQQPAGGQIREHMRRADDARQYSQAQEQAAMAAAAVCQRELDALQERQAQLRAREPQWRELAAIARRLAVSLASPVTTVEELNGARELVARYLATSAAQETTLSEQRERLLAEAQALLAVGGPFSPELLQLRDVLGAELLAGVFEEATPEEAAWHEARLGPLLNALVVDDVQAASQQVSARAAALPEVWLVARDAPAALLPPAEEIPAPGVKDVIVPEGAAWRVTRLPTQPRLGRKSREQRAQELRDAAEALIPALERARAERRRLERLATEGDALLAEQAAWQAGDPTTLLPALDEQLAACAAQRVRYQQEAEQARTERQNQERQDAAWRDLLGVAVLLDPPDQAQRQARLSAEHAAACAARDELQRGAALHPCVEDQLSVLRQPPLSAPERAALDQEIERLAAERVRLDAASEALAYVVDHRDAFAWHAAPVQLANQVALLPALTQQQRDAVAAAEAAEAALRDAEQDFNQWDAAWREADAKRLVAEQQLAVAEARFAHVGIPHPTPEAQAAAQDEAARWRAEQQRLQAELAELREAKGRAEGALNLAEKHYHDMQARVVAQQQAAAPRLEQWERLQAAIVAAQLPEPPHASRSDPELPSASELSQEARHRQAIIVERLRAAHGGPPLLDQINRGVASSAAGTPLAYLETWRQVRQWLLTRLPAEIADAADPQDALCRLHDRLGDLAERLARQEADLRSESSNIARAIEVQIRAARTQVKNLNKNLDGLGFGSIQGIQVKLHPDETMEGVLRGLQEGPSQQQLFQENIPVEEALNRLFARYSGGHMGGNRLLDYREYLKLHIEIRRQGGASWETAIPSRLSTGEAIGVGAALMMCVLAEWEKTANLLRDRRSDGTLRFMFLDEANRLSADNLGILFDLCQGLDLQLLIAAPEVARAEGNTTYRLVRSLSVEGREEVLASGRTTRVMANVAA